MPRVSELITQSYLNGDAGLGQLPAPFENRFDEVNAQLADTTLDLYARGINVRMPPSPLPAASGDGTTNDSSALSANFDVGGGFVIPSGTYLIGSNLTIPRTVILIFAKGAKFKVPAGVTLTIEALIQAGNQEIFEDAGGIIDLDNSPNEYNLSWFMSGTGYINQRWDFARRGMKTFRKKIVRFSKPYEGQAGVFKLSNRLFWLFNDQILFSDQQNCCTVYIDSEFYAANDCTNFMLFDDPDKPENIYFYGDLQVLIPASINVTYGLNMKALARSTFFGNVVINGAKTSVKMGGSDQNGAVGDVRFFELQCSFFTNAAVSIYGRAGYTVQNINIDNLSATAAQVAGANVAELRGLLRDIKIANSYYATDVPKDGYDAFDAENVIYIESNAEGAIYHVEVGGIYQANANNGLKITSAVSDSSRIVTVVVRRIFGKNNGSAANIDWCVDSRIYDVENTSDVTIGSNALYTGIITGARLRTLTDNGSYTTINGTGKQNRGVGVLPAANLEWPVGTQIRETSDGKVYLRVAKTGVATADFVKISHGASGIVTLASGATTTTVTHGLGYFPGNILATPKGNIGNWWISGITTSQFVVNCSAAPGANTDISWRAE